MNISIENWIEIISLIIDFLKTILPYGILGIILWYFRKELKNLINTGALKITTPGFTIETARQQTEKMSPQEKKELAELNTELENTKKAQHALQQLQKDTERNKKTFFLGYHFEKTYRVIFPSQMAILIFMNEHRGEMQDVLAEALFKRTIWAQNFGVTYKKFLDFLIDSGLLDHNTERTTLKLSPLGKTFLDYIANNNIPTKLPANDSTLFKTTGSLTQ